MKAEKEECPGYHPEALRNSSTNQPFDLIAQTAVGGVFVAVVQTGNNGVRRRVYLGLVPAQRAVQRARAAGVNASLVVAELHPVEVP